ncbi:MAG: hypothetical protein ACK53Y_02990, partial [bacterium]
TYTVLNVEPHGEGLSTPRAERKSCQEFNFLNPQHRTAADIAALAILALQKGKTGHSMHLPNRYRTP